MRKKAPAIVTLICALFTVYMANAQDSAPPKIQQVPVKPQSAASSLTPLEHPATTEQIREYLKLSGDLDSFRDRWIAALDENRSLGAPYWPESFWTAAKEEMRKTDLVPMFTELFQHGISEDLMHEVLATYHALGRDHFKGSPACFKLGDAELSLVADMDKLKLAKTQEVLTKVYDEHKAEIKAARAKYLAEHPSSSVQ